MRNKRVSIVIATVLVFVLVMAPTAYAVTGDIISNSLTATFIVVDEATASVESLEQLTAALTNEKVTTINITSNISSTAPVIVNRQVTINGGGYMLSFTGLEDIASTTDDGLILNATSTVNNLIVDAGLKDINKWSGTYAIHVYKASAVLNDVSATGANGGILVNGSSVTFIGKIDVSGNGSVGIESSRGSEVEADPSLNLADATVINSTETHAMPTMWEDVVTKTIIENTAQQFTTNGVVSEKHVLYFLNPLNATFVSMSGLSNTPISANIGETKTAVITTSVSGLTSINSKLIVEVTNAAGISESDVTFSLDGAIASSGVTTLKFASGNILVTNGGTINFGITFNTAGTYTVNAYLVQAE
jgi:hypothetical protein